MPNIHRITYSLDGDKQVYRPGETVSGKWTIDLGESFTIRGIRTSLEGMAYTRWSPVEIKKKDDKISKENIISQWKTVFGKKLGEDGPNQTIPAGVHTYRFSFKLPEDGLPSSYEGRYGAVRYWLRFQIDRPLLRFNIDRYKIITVLDNIDVNTPELNKFVGRKAVKKISKALGIGDQGSVTLHAQTDRGGYCPGEKIAISVLANNESEKDLGALKASLIQKTKFVASDEEKTKEYILRTVTGTPLLKKTKKTWSNQLLTIDAIPPSSRERTCHIVKVSYFLKVFVDIPLLQGGDVVLYLPVVIGTVPQGYRRPSSTAAVSSGATEMDLTSTITYTECNKGFENFKESGSGFPRLDYNPWCAYVPNFSFKQKTASTPSASAKTSKPSSSSALPPKAIATPKPSTQPPQAGPLPAKSGLPAPSVVLPTNMPAARQVHPEPSAPSIEIMPPSYEEAMAGLTGVVPEQAQEVVPEASSTQNSDDEEDKPAPKTTFIIVRFQDKFIEVFRDKLKETNEMLTKFGGDVIALAPQVIVNKGTWPAKTAIAVFLFELKQCGKEWFEQFSSRCVGENIEILDSVLGQTKEEFQNGKSTFQVTLVSVAADYKSKEWKRYATLAQKQLTPLRREMGGVSIAATRLVTPLRGSWPDSDLTMAITQWESLSQIFDYKFKLQSDEYNEINELRKKFFTVQTTIVFQTEDLGFLEDLIPDVNNYLQGEDYRQEAS